MTTIRVLIVIAGVILTSAAGCEEPGVTAVEPKGVIAVLPATAGAAGMFAAAGGSSAGASTAGAGGVAAGVAGSAAGTSGAGATAGASAAGASAAGTSAAGASGAGASGTGASGAGAGGAGGASGANASGAGGAAGTAGAAGAAGSMSPGPCPSGWTCTDLGASGFLATDKDGNEISYGCGKGGLVECNDANPATSCPELTNAICAHLDEIGIVSCTQLCTP